MPLTPIPCDHPVPAGLSGVTPWRRHTTPAAVIAQTSPWAGPADTWRNPIALFWDKLLLLLLLLLDLSVSHTHTHTHTDNRLILLQLTIVSYYTYLFKCKRFTSSPEQINLEKNILPLPLRPFVIRAWSICLRCTAAYRLIVRPLSPRDLRLSHFRHQAPPRPYNVWDPSGERWNCGQECWPVIFPKCRLPRYI
jgi:hypothetical protein